MIDAALLKRLRHAEDVVVFTGAGMSAESGVPTFRDRCTGLWARTDPSEVATPGAFRANPQRVCDWHVHLAEAVRRAAPNAGHHAVARLQRKLRVTVITQNIDNLHQDAGSREVLELHGNLLRLKPFLSGAEGPPAADRAPAACHVCDPAAADRHAAREDLAPMVLAAGPVPRCPGCGTLLRPDVVWFGEPLDPDVLKRACHASERCDVLLCVGTSLEVEPAASLPWQALARGAVVIEVNPVPTSLREHAHAAFAAGAAVVLPGIFGQVWGV